MKGSSHDALCIENRKEISLCWKALRVFVPFAGDVVPNVSLNGCNRLDINKQRLLKNNVDVPLHKHVLQNNLLEKRVDGLNASRCVGPESFRSKRLTGLFKRCDVLTEKVAVDGN